MVNGKKATNWFSEIISYRIGKCWVSQNGILFICKFTKKISRESGVDWNGSCMISVFMENFNYHDIIESVLKQLTIIAHNTKEYSISIYDFNL